MEIQYLQKKMNIYAIDLQTPRLLAIHTSDHQISRPNFFLNKYQIVTTY